jgi:hypothetical protein
VEVEKQISPLRCAPVEMTSFLYLQLCKFRVVVVWEGGVEGLISRVGSLLVISLRVGCAGSNLLVNRSAVFGVLQSVSRISL